MIDGHNWWGFSGSDGWREQQFAWCTHARRQQGHSGSALLLGSAAFPTPTTDFSLLGNAGGGCTTIHWDVPPRGHRPAFPDKRGGEKGSRRTAGWADVGCRRGAWHGGGAGRRAHMAPTCQTRILLSVYPE